MAFTISKTVPCVKSYPALLGAAVKGEEETLQVTYAVTSLVSLFGNQGVAEYSVTPEGFDHSGSGVLEFEYSGTGNPFEEAEAALKVTLE